MKRVRVVSADGRLHENELVSHDGGLKGGATEKSPEEAGKELPLALACVREGEAVKRCIS